MDQVPGQPDLPEVCGRGGLRSGGEPRAVPPVDQTWVSKFVASPLAIECSIISNFLLNNFWTFKDRNARGGIWTKAAKFKGVSLLALSVSYTTFILLTMSFPQTPAYIHQFLAIIPATLVNYFLNSYWTFKARAAADSAQPS